ncbi:MAG: ABC transporter substrate-binding protein [Thermoflexales bacterium]
MLPVHVLSRACVLLGATTLLAAACAAPPPAATSRPAEGTTAPAGEPIYIGVSGPLTGPNARYGEQWKKGFDLALEEINGRGGINGRPLTYIFEDSQSDPKQSVLVAQKFVADERIIVELGDFSSTASMAASPIYQRAGLVQFGFTNSHPDFTKGGDYMWSNSTTQEQLSPAMAEFTVKEVGLKRIAVFNINNDWGKVTAQIFVDTVKRLGADVVAVESYLPDEKDFRSALTRVREAKPDGIALISYQADGALIAQQVEAAGLKVPLIGASSLHSPDFIRLGGKAVEGTLIRAQFLPTNPDPRVKAFVDKYRAKYDETPDFFATHAYDTMHLIAKAIELGGPTRKGVREALPKLRDVPSVIYGSVTFNPETRRVSNPQFVNLIVKDGDFVAWDGKLPTR